MDYNKILSHIKFINNFKENAKVAKVSIQGANVGEKAILTSTMLPCIFVSADFVSMSEIKAELEALGKRVDMLSLGLSAPIYNNAEISESVSHLYKCVYDLQTNNLDCLFVSPEVLLKKLPSKDILLKPITVKVGEEVILGQFIKNLVKNGYKRQEIVAKKGEFAVRGDIVDIFALNYEEPLRIEFWGDTVEKIAFFDVSEMNTTGQIENCIVYPQKLFDVDETTKNHICDELKASLKASKIQGDGLIKQTLTTNEIIEKIKSDTANLENEYFMPFYGMDNNIINIFDNFTAVIDEPKRVYDELEKLHLSISSEIFDFVSSGYLLDSHNDTYLTPKDGINTKNTNYFVFDNFKSQILPADKFLQLRSIGARKYTFDYKALVSDINVYTKSKYNVVLFAGTENSRKTIGEFLNKNGITPQDEIFFESAKAQVCVSEKELLLSASFLESNIIFIGTDDLVKKSTASLFKTSAAKTKARNVFYLPKVGDYVVHQVHGIGKCVALSKLNLNGSEKDYFVIEYAGGDKLYLPSEQANLISALLGAGENPKLNKIGGQEFAKIKEKAKKSVQELAVNLVEIYHKRENSKGYVCEEDGPIYDEFEKAFRYEETPDQLTALADIKKDMMSDKIMDRLICGDVGYGKTEVAIRAMFRAVLNGRQVAFLCPTTILSEQHYQTLKNRFKDFMVNVAVVNRFRTKSQIQQILKDLKDGKIDILIGTHRLLSDDVKFNKLGLLVLDEEQRFGVADKEKIKEIKSTVDVLTLSATPIPRTLNMALTGIRDISIIATPPKQRLPITTYVAEESESLIESACKRELSRGGQVLYVVNRIEKIDKHLSRLRALLPNARIGIAHGQMPEKLLEDTILKLYNKEYDILIATTLIESGIDLPQANTMIIIDADCLGLAQLYQLRGRIGRSNVLAYAYFTYNPAKTLTEDAYSRLQAIMEFTELGSGFKIAMRDLEIRGAGNVLGKQQHGHMEKIGYELYCKLLDEEVKKLKGKKVFEAKPIKLDIVASANISADYVPQEDERIKLYSKISEISSRQEYDTCKNDMKEAFGQMPVETERLLKIAYLKNLASFVDIKMVVINQNVCKMTSYKCEKIINEKLSEEMSKYPFVSLKFENDPVLIFDINNQSIDSKIDFVIKFLEETNEIKSK